jgi:hypothetical protein
MKSSIICPHCHTPISLDDALTGQIRSSLEKDLTQSYEQRLVEERTRVENETRKKIEDLSGKELKILQEQLQEEKKKREEAEKQELLLRKKERELEERQEKMELEITRKMDEERKKIKESTELALIEQQRHKDLEKDKQINDLKKLLEDAQRKANQGSQQTQGEVQELELERMLMETFRDDVIEPIGKGVNGADIRQIVRSSRGTVCGVILWESKQTKAWSEGWIGKLKNDQRAEKADISIIVTAVFNDPSWSGITLKDGVWVCNFKLFLPLAISLRKSLLDVGREKAMSQGRGEKADLVYAYVTSQAFRQQMEVIAEVYLETKAQIDKERAAMEKIWKMREAQAQRIYTGLGSIYGTVQGLAGASVLPELKGLDLLDDGI